MTKWAQFIERQLGRVGWTGARLADEAGFNKSLVTDWRNKGMLPSVKNARLTAIALQIPVAEAFIAAGFAEPDELLASEVDRPVSAFSNEELVTEISRRLLSADYAEAGDSGVGRAQRAAARRHRVKDGDQGGQVSQGR